MRLPGSSSEKHDRVFFKTAGPFDLRPYTIRLLLLFCDLSIKELTELTQDSTTAGLRVGGSATENHSKEDKPFSADRTDQRDSSKAFDRKRTRKGDASGGFERNHFSLSNECDEEHEIRWEEVRKVNVWDARRRGCTYLCKENLDALQQGLNGRHGSL